MIPMMPVQEVGFIDCVKFTISRQSDKTFYMPAQSQVRFCGIGVASAIFDMVTLVQNVGTVNVAEIYKGSAITHSEAPNAFTVSNSSVGAVTVYVYVFNGSVQDTPLTS